MKIELKNNRKNVKFQHISGSQKRTSPSFVYHDDWIGSTTKFDDLGSKYICFWWRVHVRMMAATRILGQFGAFVVHVLRNQRYVSERCAYKEQYEQCWGSPRRVPGVDMHQTGLSLLWIIVYLCFTTFLHSSHNYFCHLLHEKPKGTPWKPLRRYCRKVCSLLLICRINCAETTIVLRCKTHSSWREIGEAANRRRRWRLCVSAFDCL